MFAVMKFFLASIPPRAWASSIRPFLTLPLFVALTACGPLNALHDHLTGSWFGVSPPKNPESNQIRNKYEQIIESYQEKKDPSSNNNAQKEKSINTIEIMSPIIYVETGYQYVDDQCDEFFSSLIILSQKTDFAKSGLNIFGGAAAAVLGTLEVSAKAIALTAVGFAGAEEFADSYQQYALLAPYATSAHKLITDAQKVYRQNVTLPTTNDEQLEKVQAARIVQGYARLCTIEAILDFVDQSIQIAEPRVDDPARVSVLNEFDRAQLGQFAKIQTLGEDDLAALFFYMAAPKANEISLQQPQNAKVRTVFNTLSDPTSKELTNEGEEIFNVLTDIKNRNDAFRNAITSYLPPEPVQALAGGENADTSPPSERKTIDIPTISLGSSLDSN